MLAVDLGERRIGLALSDAVAHDRVAAHGARARSRYASSDDHAAILAVAREHEVGEVVVGMPLSLSGRAGPAARAAEAEIGALG